jgi:DNA polymerase elongation subunit (family B)
MFSYKIKNYALLDLEGHMAIKGSALRSRGIERYLRDVLSSMIQLLLEEKGDRVQGLFEDYMEKLSNHRLEIALLAKTETLTESPEGYLKKVQAKKRNPAATYELALASDKEYRAGDQISYYVTGNKKKVRVYENCKLATDYDPADPDENIPYYQEKLRALLKKFDEFVPPFHNPKYWVATT